MNRNAELVYYAACVIYFTTAAQEPVQNEQLPCFFIAKGNIPEINPDQNKLQSCQTVTDPRNPGSI